MTRGIRIPIRIDEIAKTSSEVCRSDAAAVAVVWKKVVWRLKVVWGLRKVTKYACAPFSTPDSTLIAPSLFFEILWSLFFIADPTSNPVTIIGMMSGSWGIGIDSNNSANLYKANYSQ
jgi:hypothetical protein